MALDDTLALPFFDDDHRRFAEALARWADAKLPSLPHDDVDEACRARVKALGEAGILKVVVPQGHGGLHPKLDVRTTRTPSSHLVRREPATTGTSCISRALSRIDRSRRCVE